MMGSSAVKNRAWMDSRPRPDGSPDGDRAARARRSITKLTLGCALLVACGDDDSPPPPPPRDAMVDAPVIDDAGLDDAGLDATRPDGATDDSGIVAPGRCTVDPGEGLMVVGTDTDTGFAHVASDSSATASAIVFSDDLGGARGLRLVTIDDDGVQRSALDGVSPGSRSADVASIGDEWWVVAVDGGALSLHRFDTELARVGTATELATSATDARITRAADGALVAWREGSTVRARRVSAAGAPGATFDLGTASGAFDLNAHGTDGAVLLNGGTDASPARVAGRRVPSEGSATTLTVGGSEESVGSVGVAGPTTIAPSGTLPFYGAVAFDVRIGDAFRSVRLAVLDVDGVPAYGEYRVSAAGEYAWASSATAWGGGYVVAYRARAEDGGFSRVRVAVLDRESCEVGRVDEQITVGVAATEVGSPTTVTATEGGERFVVAWGETLEDVVEYRIAIGRCE